MKQIIKYSLLLLILICHFVPAYPAVSAAAHTYPDLNAEAAVLMDAKTGQVLFEKNMNELHYPASITKVMTGMLALEKGNLNDVITMSTEAVFSIGRNSSHIALDSDEELTLEEALYAIAIASANDAANGIAEHIAGSPAGFAHLMNEKARECGAEHTNFVNAHGLPDEKQFTTAYDMAKIMRAAIKTPGFTKVFGEVFYEMPPTNKQSEIRYFHSRNRLVNGNLQYPGIIAGKSGWTSQANHTLVTAAARDDRTLIAVVLNSQSRNYNYEDTIKLFDYGFEEFRDITIDISDLKTMMPGLDFNTIAEDKLIRLIHKDLSLTDLEKSYVFLENNIDNVRFIVSLNLKQPQSIMYEDLGPVMIEAGTLSENVAEAEASPSALDSFQNNYAYILPAGIGLLGFCLTLVISKRKRSRNTLERIRRRYY